MKLLIATTKQPIEFKKFCAAIRELAADCGATVTSGILVTMGPGCVNVAMEIDAENARFCATLTMCLMPARWTETTDDLPKTDTNLLLRSSKNGI